MRVGIIGAGPAGLSAAFCLQKRGIDVTVFEASPHLGGMSRSMELWGHRVDLGPHRFLTKDPRVSALWHETLGDRYRLVERKTRIYYRGRFFDYPLKIGNVLRNLGFDDIVRICSSYAKEMIFPERAAGARNTFEDWVVHQFGRRLFEIFFKSYSEKLWGISCRELDADFAAQRIKHFSLWQSILAALGVNRDRHKTLADIFAYPKAGTGDVYERMAKTIIERGGVIHVSTAVARALTQDRKVTGLALRDGSIHAFAHVISTMPLNLLVKGLDGTPPDVVAAASRLRFRNTVLVYLKLETSALFPDQWIYVHSDTVAVGRITNFRNWVPELYGAQTSTVLALEYWCDDEDALWTASDQTLIARGERELQRIDLQGFTAVSAGHVVRLPRCYPVYARGYRETLSPIVEYLKSFDNLWAIGRYGAFKYNNQDHSLLMGLLVAENIADGRSHDLWSVNTDYDSYVEAGQIVEPAPADETAGSPAGA
jgi:protoporphyrinogen oxidase